MGLYYGETVYGVQCLTSEGRVIFELSGPDFLQEAKERFARLPDAEYIILTLRECTSTLEYPPYTYRDWVPDVDNDIKNILQEHKENQY